MKKLSDFPTTTREWGKYTLRVETKVIGWQKTHLGEVATVVEDRDPKPGTYKVGQVFSAAPRCNGNGQHKGNGVRPQLDTQDITCLKCQKWL